MIGSGEFPPFALCCMDHTGRIVPDKEPRLNPHCLTLSSTLACSTRAIFQPTIPRSCPWPIKRIRSVKPAVICIVGVEVNVLPTHSPRKAVTRVRIPYDAVFPFYFSACLDILMYSTFHQLILGDILFDYGLYKDLQITTCFWAGLGCC